jgi:hypothetical protein
VLISYLNNFYFKNIKICYNFFFFFQKKKSCASKGQSTEESSSEDYSSSESEESALEEPIKSYINKNVCCLFCMQNTFDIEKHLKKNHLDEANIQELFNLDKNSHKRQLMLQNIVDSGNCYVTSTKIANKDNNKKKSNVTTIVKKTVCKFCFKTVGSLYSHLLSKQHVNEPEVKVIGKLDTQNEKKALLNKFCEEIFYRNNLKCIKTGKGIFTITYQGKTNSLNNKIKLIKPDTYEPCQYCLNFFRKKMIEGHTRSCKQLFENIYKKFGYTYSKATNCWTLPKKQK